MNIYDLIAFDQYETLILAIDFMIVTVMLTLVGIKMGIIANVSSVKELSEKDNFAFGISFAGAMLGLGIMMTGVVSGDASSSLMHELMLVSAYGLLGIALMASTRYFFDKITLRNISIHQQIMDGNFAVGIVDAGNMIATAIIVRAVMVWVDTEEFYGLAIVMLGFIISQLLLVLVTRYRHMVYARRHEGKCLQAGLAEGNKALAIRYLGHKIGAALTVTAASGFIGYNDDVPYMAILQWGGASILLVVTLSLLAILSRLIILRGINVVEEVDNQRNVGIGLIEAAIYIIYGLLLAALFAPSA